MVTYAEYAIFTRMYTYNSPRDYNCTLVVSLEDLYPFVLCGPNSFELLLAKTATPLTIYVPRICLTTIWPCHVYREDMQKIRKLT